jgi:hypothetical protein
MTDTDTSADATIVETVEDAPTPNSPKIAWRSLVGAAIGGGAIVIAALLGIGAIKSEGSSNVRAGGPGGGPGGQFQFRGPQGQGGPQFGPQGQVPPPFMQQQQSGRSGT